MEKPVYEIPIIDREEPPFTGATTNSATAGPVLGGAPTSPDLSRFGPPDRAMMSPQDAPPPLGAPAAQLPPPPSWMPAGSFSPPPPAGAPAASFSPPPPAGAPAASFSPPAPAGAPAAPYSPPMPSNPFAAETPVSSSFYDAPQGAPSSFAMPVPASDHAGVPAVSEPIVTAFPPEPSQPAPPAFSAFVDTSALAPADSSSTPPWSLDLGSLAPPALPTPHDDLVEVPASAPSVSTVKVGEDHSAALLEALREVIFRAASDLHISAGAPPMLRIDGALSVLGDGQPWSREMVRSTLTSLLSPLERDRFEENLELDFAYTLSSNARFRVNYYQDRGSMGAAFRIIPNEITQLADLGVPAQVGQFAALRRGLVLVTGPTGSGKSTTLAALIDLVNTTRTDHIVTVEDPIEFLHRNKKSLVHQREVGRDTHSFSSALKHVLRQDPDVILIGELRDLETVSTALTAAETGHLVFATLHTQDAPQTIDRLIDVFPPHQQAQVRAQVASTLQGVVSQVLVKSANGPGRVVATEVLMTTPAVSNLIREGKLFQIRSAMHAGRDLGMHTMDQHLADLVEAGKITAEAALEKAQDTQALAQMLWTLGVGVNPAH